ncbi:MAG: heparin lyase I family protein [Gammaproteobacteria bacterium]|nr:heparin lyase I family protein [Gammaproteobacteria bacterium]
MNTGLRYLICLCMPLIATQALAAGMSGWSDKTVCRLALQNPDNTDYFAEGYRRSLSCVSNMQNSEKGNASATGNTEKVGEKSNVFDGDYPFLLSRFNSSEGIMGLGGGILVIQNGAISVAPTNRFLDTSSTKYYDTLKGKIDKKGNVFVSFDVNPLHGKGRPQTAFFSGNINDLQIKGVIPQDDFFQLLITFSDDTSSMSSDGLTISASKNSGYGSHSNFNGQNEQNFQLITNPDKARKGKKYQRFELGDGDCFPTEDWNDCETDRERVEFTASPRLKPTGNQCFAFSIMLDKSFQDVSPTNASLGQIHQMGGPKGTAGGFQSIPPLIQFDVRYGHYSMNWHVLKGSASNVIDQSVYYKLMPIDDMKGKWSDISFCLNFADNNISVWINGNQKLDIDQSPINAQLIPSLIYFKHGIYRSFISKYKASHGKDIMPTQIVYYDEVRRGSSISEVDTNINPSLRVVD